MKNKICEFFKSYKFNIIFNLCILLLFFIMTFGTMLHHELWRDEAQAWLVVRDLSIAGIFDHVKTEGHPLLWYIILLPFAKLHIPVISMQVLSFLLSLCAAGIFVFYSPFDKLTKTAVLFSSGMAYWYSIIARSYSLIPLLLFLCAIVYPERHKKTYIYTALLILLSNTHVLMFGFCIILSVIFLYELLCERETRKKIHIILPIILLGANFSLITFYLASGRHENTLVQNFVSQSSTITNIYQTILSVIQNIYGSISMYTCIFLIAIIFILWGMLYKTDKKIFLCVSGGIIFQLLVYRYIWITSSEKAFLVLLILLFGFWATNRQSAVTGTIQKISNILLTILFLFTWNISYTLVKNDLIYDYSGSKKAAEYIKNNIPHDAVIISNYNVTTAGISAYLPEQKFFFPTENCFYTFSKWNNGIMNPFVDYKSTDMANRFETKKIYLIFSYIFDTSELSEILPPNAKNIYNQSRVLLKSEKFYIYELKNNE